MSEVEEIKERIINASTTLFERYGFRRVTMDELASHMAISKKTIYQYFSDKKDLIQTVAHRRIEEQRKVISHITSTSDNSIEELHRLSIHVRETIYKYHPTLMIDLQRYYASVWEEYVQFKREFVLEHIKDNLHRGIKEGYFKPDIDPEILSVLRMEQIEMCFDTQKFPPEEFDFAKVQQQFWEHYLNGILSEEGKSLLKKYQENSEE